MARAKSAVLSAADKKAVITKTKADLKIARDAVKANVKAAALADATHAKSQAVTAKAMASADKLHVKGQAVRAKELAALTKVATKLEADLTAMTPVLAQQAA